MLFRFCALRKATGTPPGAQADIYNSCIRRYIFVLDVGLIKNACVCGGWITDEDTPLGGVSSVPLYHSL